jgi:hypothetical protein
LAPHPRRRVHRRGSTVEVRHDQHERRLRRDRLLEPRERDLQRGVHRDQHDLRLAARALERRHLLAGRRDVHGDTGEPVAARHDCVADECDRGGHGSAVARSLLQPVQPSRLRIRIEMITP